MRKYFTAWLLIISSTTAWAQHVILGRVLDKRTEEPIHDVQVKVEESGVVTKTTYKGYFQLTVDPGVHLTFKKPGYVYSRLELPPQKKFKLYLQPTRLDTPEYRLGNKVFYRSLLSNVRYPAKARALGIEGKFYVSFDIDTTGNIVNTHLLNKHEDVGGIDEELVTAFQGVPGSWIPAHTVYNFVLPVTFRLGNQPKDFPATIDVTDRHLLSEVVITASSATAPGSTQRLSSKEVMAMLNGFIVTPRTSKEVAYTIEEALQDPAKTKLYLHHRQLKQLPATIGALTQLTYLDIEGNRVGEFPEAFGKLANLAELYAASNRIASLPATFAQLQQLTTLGLAGNKLEQIPEQVFRLQKLEYLDLGNNKITLVPESIGRLKHLKLLVLSENKLRALPASLSQLKHLEKLFLTGNRIPLGEIVHLKKVLPDTQIIY